MNFQLKKGDCIGILSPSRPLGKYKKEVLKGIQELKTMGFRVKCAANWDKKYYYESGTVNEKLADIYELFSDQDVKAIICSIGGSSSNKLLDKIDYDLIRINKKILIGYSDNTSLLLACQYKAKIKTFHGPDVYEFSRISSEARKFFRKCFSSKNKVIRYPKTMSVWREGKAKGKLFGGNLTLINSLLGSNYIKAKKGSILFWEEIGESPAMIDFKLHEMRLKGLFNQINGMIVGKLTDCQDKKYPEDDRPIKDILLEATQKYNFPIVKVDWFGHEVNDFYIMPLDCNASLDTYKKKINVN